MLVEIKNNFESLWRKLLLFWIIMISVAGVSAQLNTEIGYSVSYMSGISTNKIIDRYNQNQEMIRDMKNLNFIDGFNAGLTYRKGIVKYGVFWESQTAKRTAIEGTLTGVASEKTLLYYFNSIGGGLAMMGNNIGLGATLDYSLFRLKTNKSGIKERIDIIKDNYFSNKLYLIFNFRLNNRLAVEFKPFVRIPWTNTDLYPMADYLGVVRNTDFSTSNFVYYGISFSILNGRQPG
jgi:hypothetical protein